MSASRSIVYASDIPPVRPRPAVPVYRGHDAQSDSLMWSDLAAIARLVGEGYLANLLRPPIQYKNWIHDAVSTHWYIPQTKGSKSTGAGKDDKGKG